MSEAVNGVIDYLLNELNLNFYSVLILILINNLKEIRKNADLRHIGQWLLIQECILKKEKL